MTQGNTPEGGPEMGAPVGPPYGGAPYPPPGAYPYPPPGAYPAPGQLPPVPASVPPPPKKRSIGKRLLSMLGAVVALIAVKVGFGLARDQGVLPSTTDDGFNYAVGTCLEIKTTLSFVKPEDVHELPCSSPAALVKVGVKYKGSKQCPNDNYGTLGDDKRGLCLQDNLTVGNCYQPALITHFFQPHECTAGFTEPTLRVALRKDGVSDPGLCVDGQQPLEFPEPPLTYCLETIGDSSRP